MKPWSKHKIRLVVLIPIVFVGIGFWIIHGEHSQEWTLGALMFYVGLYIVDYFGKSR